MYTTRFRHLLDIGKLILSSFAIGARASFRHLLDIGKLILKMYN